MQYLNKMKIISLPLSSPGPDTGRHSHHCAANGEDDLTQRGHQESWTRQVIPDL